MIFTIQTDDEVAGLDITNALSQAGIQHTILSKQNDNAAQHSVQRTCLKSPDGNHHFEPGESQIICVYCGASR